MSQSLEEFAGMTESNCFNVALPLVALANAALILVAVTKC